MTDIFKALASPLLTAIGIFLFQDAPKLTDYGGIIGSILGFAGVALGIWQSGRNQRVQRQLERQKEHTDQAKKESDKAVEHTKEVIDGWKELVTELKDGRKIDRQHIIICERQQQYMQAKLLKAGVFDADDMEALAKFELMFEPRGHITE